MLFRANLVICVSVTISVACVAEKDDPEPAENDDSIDHISDGGADEGDKPEATEPADSGTDTGEALPEPSCENYCSLVQTNCGDSGTQTSQYASEQACLDYCNTWAKLPVGDKSDTSSNSIGCRIYHADTAGGDPDLAEIHCPHAGPDGADVCGLLCDNYCHLALLNCLGSDAVFADEAACQAACNTFPSDATSGATTGDSVQCRIYHLGVAGSDIDGGSASTHCPHGAAEGGGVCVSETPSCETYCAAVQAACEGTNAQYNSLDSCLSYCGEQAQLPLGESTDTAGNTVGCRSYHAGVAAGSDTEAALHCLHAGPSGGDVCGSWCDNYCYLANLNCGGDDPLFPGDGDCQATCAAYATDGAPGATTGDSVQCRIYHLGVAGSGGDAPDLHCPHGSVEGGGMCVNTLLPTCEVYCSLIQASCTGDNAQYGDASACLNYCNTWAQLEPGAIDDTGGNTIACRIYHATVAGESDPTLHCAHAGPSGGDTCGSWCTVYCDLASTNCTGENALYPADECLEECESIGTAGTPGDAAGDSIQCRIYHLGVAGSDVPGGSAEIHCPHGSSDGGGVCVPPPDCKSYCTAIQATCTGENTQYNTDEQCIDYCENWAALAPGDFTDKTGNTIGCRLYHVGVAALGEPEIHCLHAGPAGGDVCGSWCENYCALADKNCSGDDALFGVEESCKTACTAYPADAPTSATEGDSVQCRIYHLGVAGSAPPESATVHCPHGGVSGGGVCSPPPPTCEEYCAAITAACSDGDTQYASEAACLDYCMNWAQLPAGTKTDTSGNTIGCRLYHTQVAAMTDAAIHCAHAGPSGGDACGTWCDNYCHLSDVNCTGGLEQYEDQDQCLAACSGFVSTASPGSTGGDSVQCRLYHLGVAGSDISSGSANTHCPHGDIDGGGVCENAKPSCEVYCGAVQAACGDAGAFDSQFASHASCMSYCETWSGWAPTLLGEGTDTNQNSVGCRTYHARVASKTEPLTHCPHAGAAGGNVCGSWCSNYCQLSEANCTGGNELYGDNDECTISCVLMPKEGNPGDIAGSSVQCRIYHLGVAGSDGATSAAIHCPHGSKSGGGVCVGEVDAPGDTCESAYTIGSVPYEATSSTAGANGVYGFAKGDCPGVEAAFGGASGEQIFSFQPEASGSFLVTLDAKFEAVLYVMTNCGSVSSSCVGASSSSGLEELILTLEAETTYYIVVDGASNSSNQSGAYTLSVDSTVPCVPDCIGKDCGDDGCEESCGACAAGSSCLEGACVEDPPPPTNPTYEKDVQPVFAKYCTPCHSGGQNNACSGGSCFVNFYSATQFSSYTAACAISGADKKGACAIVRIKNGTMPQLEGCSGDPTKDAGNAACSKAKDQAVIQAWVDAGMPEK